MHEDGYICHGWLAQNTANPSVGGCMETIKTPAFNFVCMPLKVTVRFTLLRPNDAYRRHPPRPSLVQIWLVAWLTPSHYLDQCWSIVNLTRRNKLHWNVNRNSYIFIQENAFENVVCKMVVILSRPQYVNRGYMSETHVNRWQIYAVYFCRQPTKIPPEVMLAQMYKKRNLGAVSIRKTVLPGMAIPMLKIRRPNGRLIFNMEIAIRR